MTEQLPETERWLTLSQAAHELGIHTTTLRRWADNGDISVMLTPGGHRRFASSDVIRFARERRGLRRVQGIEQVWADRALIETRQQITGGQQESWLTSMDMDIRSRHRLLGQQLLGLTLQYLSDEKGGQILAEARSIGQQYALLGLETKMPLADVMAASMFFRDMLIETALQLPENTRIRPDANIRLLRRVNTLLNQVQLAIAEVYDVGPPDVLSRS